MLLLTLVNSSCKTGVGQPGGAVYPGSVNTVESVGGAITISEEFLHEYHNPVNPDWISMFFQHKVHEAEKLCIFHPESFSPPPEV